MMTSLRLALNIAITVFAVASMFAVGARFRLRDILRPFGQARGLALVLIANFILVPLLGFWVAHLVWSHPSLATGLILIGTAAGAPFLLRLTMAAAGDLAFSSGILVILLLVTIVTMPFLVPLAVPLAVVRATAIAVPLLLTMLLPLGIGCGVRMRFRHWARRLWPLATQVSTMALAMTVVLALGLNWADVVALIQSGAILAIFILIGGAYAIGWAMGEVGGEARTEVGLATAQRNIAAASVVAIDSFHDPDVLVMVVVAAMLGLAVLFPIAAVARRRRNAAARAAAAKERKIS